MFSSVESCRTKRANNRLVASSIIAIRYNFSPRPSSQSCSLVSHCTNSPNRLRRGRHTCTCLTLSFFTRHNLPRIIHFRTVSLLASMPCLSSKYSAANVGPTPLYTSADALEDWLRKRQRTKVREFHKLWDQAFSGEADRRHWVAALRRPARKPMGRHTGTASGAAAMHAWLQCCSLNRVAQAVDSPAP